MYPFEFRVWKEADFFVLELRILQGLKHPTSTKSGYLAFKDKPGETEGGTAKTIIER